MQGSLGACTGSDLAFKHQSNSYEPEGQYPGNNLQFDRHQIFYIATGGKKISFLHPSQQNNRPHLKVTLPSRLGSGGICWIFPRLGFRFSFTDGMKSFAGENAQYQSSTLGNKNSDKSFR